MTTNSVDAVAAGLRTISIEQQGLTAMAEALGAPGEDGLGSAFRRAVEIIAAAPGRVIVTGLGKSGHVGRKIAATFASTGQPAFFVHATEASHGDLGMVQNGDVVIAVSWSGETPELAAVVTYAKRFAIPLIAITANGDSALGREADVRLCLPNTQEACPNGLAPTTSTTMQLVLGDALAMALLEGKGFTAHDFQHLPPRRQARRQARVRARRHASRRPHPAHSRRRQDGRRDPRDDAPRASAASACSTSRGALVGIITDGDLRRHLKSHRIVDTPVEEVMTRSPRTIAPDALVAEALEIISRKISALLVVEAGEVVGIIHFHDLLGVGAA